ncbi:GntR family transcriptional regulator [Streptomyces sp. NPDC059010]|uniref:GntR family transcriptional regulator n=1 Tax=Streptomyces sp. NPDC059010 TaxID=3346695 RepID=UPI003686A06C
MDAEPTGGIDGREFLRIADELRVRMTDGTYVRGSFLPSQRDLAEEFAVSRDTVQRDITERHTASLRLSLNSLSNLGVVPSVDLQIRHVPPAPTSKPYLLNGVEALQGPYEVIERRIELEPDEEVVALDVLVLGATLTHHVKDDDPNSPGTVFVGTMQRWFDSLWNLLAQ